AGGELYVEPAPGLGCNDNRIMFRHILPNVTAPIIVLVTVGLGNAIIIEASLSFLGLGTPPPASSWGRPPPTPRGHLGGGGQGGPPHRGRKLERHAAARYTHADARAAPRPGRSWP